MRYQLKTFLGATGEQACNSINKEGKVFTENFRIGDRVSFLAKSADFIMLKDHKEYFRSNPKCRSINSTKSTYAV